MRATLEEHDQPIALAQELTITQAYARIETQRLGSRLRFAWDIPDALLDAAIPPLSLQPLVENAVRHGIETLAEGGTISIQAAMLDDRHFCIQVENPLNQQASNPGTGEALNNIRQRLQWLFGPDAADLHIRETADQFVARLSLPLKHTSST